MGGGCSGVGYKSVLILGEMVYVKQMHEDSFSLVRAAEERKLRLDGGKQAAVSLLLWVVYAPDLRRNCLLLVQA